MTSHLPGQIIMAIRSVIGSDVSVSLHEPVFGGNEWAYVKECLDTGWVSSVGKFVDRFEQDLAAYTGAKRAVAVVNGTVALQICLQLVGVEQDDEVVIPALTFVATANAVRYCGAVPHLADSNEITLGLDPQKLAVHLEEITEMRGGMCINRCTGRRIKAVVPMHTFGHPVDLDPLLDLCERYRLELVEDAAESLGSYYKGRHTGTMGRCAVISFNGNKTITTGGGGAILTNDNKFADSAKHLTTTAKIHHRWEFKHDMVGYNYRMPNINAALGCAQLEQIDKFIAAKRSLADVYAVAFDAIEGVSLVREPSFARSNYWLNALILDEECASERDTILEATNDAGIMTRPAWTLMNQLPMYADCPSMDLGEACSIEQRLINIPSSSFLGGLCNEAS